MVIQFQIQIEINVQQYYPTEIGSGAITSFTQEQALAGAGGTAAFTAYGISNYLYYIRSKYNLGTFRAWIQIII